MPSCAKTYAGNVITNDCIAQASALPAGVVGDAYSETLTAPDLVAPLLWVVLNGTIPDGLELGEDTGEIFGVPTLESDYSFQVQVTDTNGIQCLKDFTLEVNTVAPPVSCGWWSDFPLVDDNVPVGPGVVTTIDPSGSLTGVVDFTLTMDVAADVHEAPGMSVSGTKVYTGPAVIMKFLVEVPIFESPEPGSFIEVVFDGVSIGMITAAGSYEYTADLDVSVAAGVLFGVSISRAEQIAAGTIECNVRLIACESTIGAADGFYFVAANPFFYYSPTGAANPTATITVASNSPVTWDIANSFRAFEWAVPPTITLDGVPLTFHVSGPNWVLDLATVDTDECTIRTFLISGPTVSDPTGFGTFQLVPQ